VNSRATGTGFPRSLRLDERKRAPQPVCRQCQNDGISDGQRRDLVLCCVVIAAAAGFSFCRQPNEDDDGPRLFPLLAACRAAAADEIDRPGSAHVMAGRCHVSSRLIKDRAEPW
jgi:hypothetical protein